MQFVARAAAPRVGPRSPRRYPGAPSNSRPQPAVRDRRKAASSCRSNVPVRLGGDVIVEIDGKDVRNPDDVGEIIARRKPGYGVKLVILRDSPNG